MVFKKLWLIAHSVEGFATRFEIFPTISSGKGRPSLPPYSSQPLTRETTLHSLLFTPRGVTALQDFIQRTGVATRQWLLQRTDEREGGNEWEWGRLREEPEEDSVER